jgi:hypothetical protein
MGDEYETSALNFLQAARRAPAHPAGRLFRPGVAFRPACALADKGEMNRLALTVPTDAALKNRGVGRDLAAKLRSMTFLSPQA